MGARQPLGRTMTWRCVPRAPRVGACRHQTALGGPQGEIPCREWLPVAYTKAWSGSNGRDVVAGNYLQGVLLYRAWD